jgi:hypothetical protein
VSNRHFFVLGAILPLYIVYNYPLGAGIFFLILAHPVFKM